MSTKCNFMKHLLNILFWSVISAAFIGPGTVTTAASSGANFGFALLWALVFSTFACVVLQEASARITIISGKNLGQAIREQFKDRTSGLFVLLLVLGAIILGCAAYEAGNILGGVAGAALGTGISAQLLTVFIGLAAGLLLYFSSTVVVARVMGVVVALMGIAFLVTAISLGPSLMEILKGSFIPSMPSGSSLLVIGLVGTTVVPYNLFLGSGIAGNQSLKDLRIGLSVAVIFGGIISMGVLVVGTSVSGTFSFDALADTLSTKLGAWASVIFSLGLFAAGFSSAITAPLAAAITAKGLFGSSQSQNWDEHSWRYRMVWLGVLLTGIVFGISNVKPIPVIIIAQALNGILLPFVAIFLITVVNDLGLMGKSNLNGTISNISMAVVVVVTIFLGATNLIKAGAAAMGMSTPEPQTVFWVAVVINLIIAIPTIRWVLERRG